MVMQLYNGQTWLMVDNGYILMDAPVLPAPPRRCGLPGSHSPTTAQPRLHLAKVKTLHDLNGCHSVMELYMPTAMIDQQQLFMTRINVQHLVMVQWLMITKYW